MGGAEVSPTALHQAAEGVLDTAGLKVDPSVQADSAKALSRQVVRDAFRASALLLTERGHPFQENTNTPERLIGEVLKRPELELPENLVSLLKTKYLSSENPAVDWDREALEMSRHGIAHPVRELSQRVAEKLSPAAKAALTRARM